MTSFALGGLQFWVTKYLSSGPGDMARKDVSLWLGLVLALASLIGTATGGFLADGLSKRSPGAYFWVSGLGMVLAIPFILVALLVQSYPIIFACIGAALTFGVFNFGPSNTILVNVTRPNIRAAAIAVNLLVLHWLGDIPSMWLVGLVSDTTQSTGLAGGEKQGLFWGLMMLTPAMALSGLFYCLGTRYFKRDQEEVLREVCAQVT